MVCYLTSYHCKCSSRQFSHPPPPRYVFRSNTQSGFFFKGGVSLWDVVTCFHSTAGRTATNHAVVCGRVHLYDIATDLSYWRDAGAVGFTFILFGLLLSLVGGYVAYLRRWDMVDELPDRLSFLEHKLVPPVLFGAVFLCYFLAWVVYVGLVEDHFSEGRFRNIMNISRSFSYDRYGAGFGLTITSNLLIIAPLLIFYFFPSEENRLGDESGAPYPPPAPSTLNPAYSGVRYGSHPPPVVAEGSSTAGYRSREASGESAHEPRAVAADEMKAEGERSPAV